MADDNTSSILNVNHCPNCGGNYGACGTHTGCTPCSCPNKITIQPQVPFMMGWKCPNCGAGMSPFASRCGCVDGPLKIWCGVAPPSPPAQSYPWTTCSVSNGVSTLVS